MIRGKLHNGQKMFKVNVTHFVKLQDFATHLTEHFYNNNEDFDNKLTKQEAVKILKRGLFFEGLNCEYGGGFFEASFEEGEKFNAIYEEAVKWVKSKYQWLDDDDIT